MSLRNGGSEGSVVEWTRGEHLEPILPLTICSPRSGSIFDLIQYDENFRLSEKVQNLLFFVQKQREWYHMDTVKMNNFPLESLLLPNAKGNV